MIAALFTATLALATTQSPAVQQMLPSSGELAGKYLWQRGNFTAPVACAISSKGIVAVADEAGELVGLNAADGTLAWRASQADGVAMVAPSAVAARADGSLLLTDSRRRRTDHIGADGAWIARFAGDVAIDEPTAIAVGRGGSPESERVAIVDGSSGAIVICDSHGKEVMRVAPGILQTSTGRPAEPAGVAFASPGHLAVVSARESRVFLVDCTNEKGSPRVEGSWGGRGAFPGFFNWPLGIAALGDWLFVADEFNHRIARHDRLGKGQLAYGQHAVLPRAGEGRVHYPVAVAVTAGLAVVCEPFERRVQAYIPSHAAEPADLRLVLPKLEGVQSHFGTAATVAGQRLFLQDPESRSIVVFDLSRGQPIHVTSLGSAGTKGHEFGSIDAMVALDGGLRLLVADNANRRLALWELTPPPKDLIFEPFMGKLVKTRPYDRLDLPDGADIVGLARTREGSIVALSDSGPTLIELDPSLRTATSMLLPMPDTTAHCTGLAVDSEGTVAVVSDAPAAISTFRSTPDRWAPQSMRPLDGVKHARAVAAAAPGTWIVVDDWGDGAVLVTPQGESSRIGTTGVGDGEFWLPSSVVVGPSGERYVVDSGNHRAQCFDAQGAWTMTFSLGRTYTRARSSEEIMRVRKRPERPVSGGGPVAPGGPS